MNSRAALTRKEFIVMDLLVTSTRAKYGLELIQESRDALKRGVIYVTLAALEQRGYISSARAVSPNMGSPRRLYRATDAGARFFRTQEHLRALYLEPDGTPRGFWSVLWRMLTWQGFYDVR